jgi:hypothetical protein
VATTAGKLLQNHKTPEDVKMVAASSLIQAAGKNKK